MFEKAVRINQPLWGRFSSLITRFVRRPGLEWAVLCAPAAVALSLDIAHRGPHLLNMSWAHQGLYLLAVFESCVVWGLLLYAAARRTWIGHLSGALFVLGFTFACGGQAYFFEQYRAYLTQDLTLFAVNLTESVLSQLAADLARYVWANAPFLVAAVLLMMVCRMLPDTRLGQRKRILGAAPVVFLACWFVPLKFRAPQAATPDTLYLNAMGAYVRSQLGVTDQSRQVRPRLRQSRKLPKLVSSAPTPRNVLLVLLESVRADASCSAFSLDCALTPHTNRLLPHRHGLLQHRSLDSTTAISLAVLTAGVAPDESDEVMHTWPLLFDYARAAGFSTAYWTSQNLFFGSSHLFVENLGVDDFVSATQLDMHADIDMGADESLLADHVISRLEHLEEPFFAMIHTSNVHHPYLVDPNRPQPFQPASFDKSPSGGGLLRNYYQNAVAQEDAHLARIFEALRATEAGSRTVIVYTSDHGESFRDHNQMGHTFSLFDEEVKVPAFIDAPPSTLTPEERVNLESHASLFTFHPDLTATALDVMGVWAAKGMEEFKSKIIGRSLLRKPEAPRTMVMTNCAAVWSCAYENWGLMHGSLKAFARTPYDTGWQCFDLASDPREQTVLNTPPCQALIGEALARFGRAPL
jgi:glucan phosphoethanolaminetransferase (alkaline phosphatase superfamily)